MAISIARCNGWIEINSDLYCPDCVEYDPETDSYKSKNKEQ